MTETVLDPKTQIGLQTSGPVERVRVNDYLKLKKEGVLVQLDVHGTSIFTTSTDWAEAGVEAGSKRTIYMRPGRKYLYPPEAVARLQNINSKLRQAFSACTQDFPGFDPYRYLHFKRYTAWADAWAKLKPEFDDVKADLIASYDAARDELAAEYNLIAREAWDSAHSSGQLVVFYGSHAYDDLDEFTDAVVGRVMSKIPTREKIEEEVTASYKTAIIQGADDVAREEAKAEQIRQQAEADAQIARIAIQSNQQAADHEKAMMALEEAEKRTKIQAMFAAEASRIREQLDDITSPLEQSFVALRQEIADAAGEMLAQVQKSGKLHGRSAKKALETLSELIQTKTIVDDQALVDRYQALVSSIGPVGEGRKDSTPERSTEAVVAALTSIQELVQTARADFQQEPSRFEFLEE